MSCLERPSCSCWLVSTDVYPALPVVRTDHSPLVLYVTSATPNFRPVLWLRGHRYGCRAVAGTDQTLSVPEDYSV
ncbi:uncharacterized protein LOC143237287 isoform X2 [Tachypleus tridentatus]|uniref:uncharacterized protein LOC143237287 isoform X2 n=1 Tax=Tachypleus tridentatus TaxID=6853 RepID=UPI003FD0BDBA